MFSIGWLALTGRQASRDKITIDPSSVPVRSCGPLARTNSIPFHTKKGGNGIAG